MQTRRSGAFSLKKVEVEAEEVQGKEELNVIGQESSVVRLEKKGAQ